MPTNCNIMPQKRTQPQWHEQHLPNYEIEHDLNAYGDIDYDFFDTESQLNSVSNSLPVGQKNPIHLIIPPSDIIHRPTHRTDGKDDKVLKKQPEMRSKSSNLMNCIAYSSPNGTAKTKKGGDQNSNSLSTDFDSLSSDTTSEMTNVTSRATSSESRPTMLDQVDDNNLQRSLRKQRKKPNRIERDGPQLLDAVGHLEIGDYGSDMSKTSSSLTSVSSSASRRNPTNRKNMSFSNSELREIDRDNRLLLQKIQGTRNTFSRPKMAAPNLKLSSSAINRRNLQEKIEMENNKIARRLQTIKPTTDTSSPWIFSRRK